LPAEEVPQIASLWAMQHVWALTLCETMCEFARQMHPKEFVALIDGKIESETLVVKELVYQQFNSSKSSASFTSFLLGPASGLGTVHSHPSSSTQASKTDLFMFSKNGLIHFIIGFPYTKETIVCYDKSGNKLEFEIR